MIMDDVFQILIFLIIIISFISSLLKKKPQQKDADHLSASEKTGETDISEKMFVPSSESKAEEFDLMKEFENFFKVEDKQAIPEPQQVEKKEPFIKDTNYKRVPEESFHKVTDSEHSFVNPWETKIKEAERKKKLITPQIEKQASAYEKSLIKKEKVATEIIENIRSRLNDPESLKEYVVFSEIIGRPKALKR